MSSPQPHASDRSLLGRIIDLFLRGDLAGLVIAVSLAAGLLAVTITPREEEPQIVVPLADVLVAAPGLSVEEVERQVATRAREAALPDRRRRVRLLDVAARARPS